jgi:putative hydrolase of the HAD superfamily
MTSYGAVIFDLWGTLVPFQRARWGDIERRIAVALGAPIDEFRSAWRASYDERATGPLEANMRNVCVSIGVDADQDAVRRAVDIRRAGHAAMFVPRDDAVATLSELRSRGTRIGLVTNCTSEVPDLWRASELASLVDVAIFSCAEGVKKPEAAIYALAADRLGVTPAECLYVGDGSDDELGGAHRGGMSAVLLAAPDTDTPDIWSGSAIERLSDLIT